MNLRQYTIGSRMAAGLSVILFIACALLGISVVANQRDRAAIGAAVEKGDEQSASTEAMHQSLLRVGIAVRNMGLQTTTEGVNAAEEAAKKAVATYQAQRKKLEDAGLSDEAKALLADLNRLVEQTDKHFKAAVGLAQQFNTEQAAVIIATKIDPLTAKSEAVLDRLSELQRAHGRATLAMAEDRARWTLTMVLGLGAAGLALSAWIGWVMSRSIVLPLRQAVDVARHVAAGDLMHRSAIVGRDETAQLLAALNDMNEGLARVVREVRSSSDSIATGSTEIATGNADLSARTERQASSLQQTASSMEDLGNTVQQNASSAAQASQLAQGAAQVAARGGEVVSQVVHTMKDITESSRRIFDIISVIDGIAFQTNILALNAAVEAARAGEQGRGFAVVASEVRNLAQRSANAAKEIKGLIATSVERVEAGNGLVEQAGRTMQDIVASIQRVSGIISEISVASQQQSGGVRQVGEAVSQMDHATQQNAALVEESAAAAESLKQQAQQLVQAVSVFKVSA